MHPVFPDLLQLHRNHTDTDFVLRRRFCPSKRLGGHGLLLLKSLHQSQCSSVGFTGCSVCSQPCPSLALMSHLLLSSCLLIFKLSCLQVVCFFLLFSPSTARQK